MMNESALRAEDGAARTIATDVTRSVVAQAPAGSGKTTLLLERYLRLLATVDEPEEILVVTFTRKAAGEIRERVQAALDRREDAAVTAVRERDRTHGWGLSTSPHRMRIQTIDAFALAIARLAPVLAGLPPQSRFAEDAEPLYRAAIDRVFERMSADEPFSDDLARVLAMFDNDYEACASALCTMLGKRDQWLDAVRVALSPGSGGDGMAHLLHAGATALARDVIGDVQDALGATLVHDLDAVAGLAAAHLGMAWGGLREDVTAWRFVGEVLTTQEGQLRRQLGVRQGFPAGARETKRQAHTLLEALRERDLDELIFNLRLLPDPVPAPGDLASLRQIAITLSLAALALTDVFERASTVDFTELTFAARRALGNAQTPTDLAMALDYRLRHLLVDEFQDTSVSQLDLLTRITDGWQPDDGRTFFAVGDPMQSIYRFRDAEVALMLRAVREGIGDLRPDPVRLRTNFRAEPALVDWVNRTFGAAFGRSDDPQLGRVAYAQSIAARPDTHRHVAATTPIASGVLGDHNPAGARVSLFTGDDTRTAETHRVVEAVEHLRAHDPAGSIALLARSRTHLDTILEAFTAGGIPWHASDIENIGAGTVVRDLMVLLDAASDLDDRLAWLSLLRAPFCGVDLADLLVLGTAPRIADAVFAFHEYPVSRDGAQRLARIAPVLGRCLARRDQQAPAIWLETTWRQLGGPEAYVDDDVESDAAHLFAALSRGASRRIDREALRVSLDRAFTRGAPEPGDVVVMTIHRAKGLEFDHVLIPGTDRETRRSEPPLLLWRAEARGLLMSTAQAADRRTYRWLAREERHREAYERLRLLYVAVTRARVSVHLFGCIDEESLTPDAGSLLHTVWPALRDEAVIAPFVAPRIGKPRITAATRLKADYRPVEKPSVEFRPIRVDPPAVTFRAPPETRPDPAVDRLLRRSLSMLASLSMPDDPERYVRTRLATWRAALQAAGVRGVEVDPGVALIARYVSNVLLDPRGRWLFTLHDRLTLDLQYTLMERGTRTRVDVDRRFVDTSGQLWLVVVDTAATSAHAAELSRWLDRIVDEEPTPARAAIYFPALPHWHEAHRLTLHRRGEENPRL